MAETFPIELQQKLNQDNFSYNIGDSSITSEVDVGLAKKRNRFTKAIDSLSCSIKLEYSDYQILKNFFDNTLSSGVKTFLYEDPFSQTDEEFRFKSAPSLRPMGGLYFMVTMEWEKIP